MKKIRKFIAIRLVALLMFPYSASAAAAGCPTTLLTYGIDNAPDAVYETVAYNRAEGAQSLTCGFNHAHAEAADATFSLTSI